MSGAQRTERKRRQARTGAKAASGTRGAKGARAVTRARRGSGGRASVIVGIAVVAVLAVVVIVGVLVTGHRASAPAGAIPPVPVSASYPVSLQDGVVVAGKPGAPRTVDAYEDFLCPVCGMFESQHADKIQAALNAGRISVRYHVVDLLDRSSNPPGYSLQAGNAALCAAEAGIFPGYHASLYAHQPEEGAAGYMADQLVALGRDLGAQGSFEQCVRSGAHDAQVKAQFAGADAALAGQGGFKGTPTVLVDGQFVDVLSQAGSARFDQLIG